MLSPVRAAARHGLGRALAAYPENMSLSLSKHPKFSGRPGPVLVVAADGFGVAPPGVSNAELPSRSRWDTEAYE